MNVLIDYARGLGAAIMPRSLVALLWSYLATLVVAAVLATVIFSTALSSVAGSAMSEQLANGHTAEWLVDLIGRDGASLGFGAIGMLAVALVPLYLVLAIFLSGGVVASVLRALGAIPVREPATFFGACARYLGPMARIALVELVVLGGTITGLAIFGGVVLAASLGNVVAWGLVILFLVVLAVVTAVFDVARIDVVAHDHRSAIKAFRDAGRFAARRAASLAIVVALNLVLSVAIGWVLLWLDSRVSDAGGAGVFLAILVGQIVVLGRLWARIAAYATEAAIYQRTETVRGEPVRVDERPFAVVEEPATAPAPESQPLG
jgi:hypothetical protein